MLFSFFQSFVITKYGFPMFLIWIRFFISSFLQAIPLKLVRCGWTNDRRRQTNANLYCYLINTWERGKRNCSSIRKIIKEEEERRRYCLAGKHETRKICITFPISQYSSNTIHFRIYQTIIAFIKKHFLFYWRNYCRQFCTAPKTAKLIQTKKTNLNVSL